MAEKWVQLILGGWILISPWLLGFSGITIMTWSNVIVGVALVLVNLWSIFGSKPLAG